MVGEEIPNDPQILALVAEIYEPYLAVLSQLQVDGGPEVTSSDFDILELSIPGVFRRKPEVTKARRALEQSLDKLKRLRIEFRKVPSLVVKRMEANSDIVTPEPGDDEEPDLIPRKEAHRSFENFLSEFEAEIESELKWVESVIEKWWAGRGRGADWEARFVAVQIARLHKKLRGGEEPKIQSGPYTSTPETLFERTVNDMLQLRGIAIKFRKPCEYAIDKMKKDQI